jgi:hypothetical protein
VTGPFSFNLFLLAIPVYFVWSAFRYEPQARYIPLLIGVFVLILQIWVAVVEWFPAFVRVFDAPLTSFGPGAGRGPSEATDPLGSSQKRRRVAVMMIWMAVFFLLLYFLGTFPATFGFIFLFLLISGRVPWWEGLAVSAGVVGIIWVLFNAMMKFELFQGILFGALVPAF